MDVYWSNFGSHLVGTDSRPLMAGEILEHSRPVQGVKFTNEKDTEQCYCLKTIDDSSSGNMNYNNTSLLLIKLKAVLQ